MRQRRMTGQCLDLLRLCRMLTYKPRVCFMLFYLKPCELRRPKLLASPFDFWQVPLDSPLVFLERRRDFSRKGRIHLRDLNFLRFPAREYELGLPLPSKFLMEFFCERLRMRRRFSALFSNDFGLKKCELCVPTCEPILKFKLLM